MIVKKRLLLVGAGRIAKVHVGSIAKLPNAYVAAVADPDECAGTAMATALGCAWFDSFQSALVGCEFDGVVIAAPTALHASLLEDCARAGLPVFCEKPIDLSLDRVDQCLRIVRSAGIPVVMGFHRRFDRSRIEAKAAVDSGSVGRMEHILQISRDPRLPSESFLSHSGGIVRDMLIHDLDELLWLCGTKAVTVQASLSRMVDPPLLERYSDYDTAAVTVVFDDGPLCQIAATRRSAYGFEQRLEVFGDQGLLVCPSPKRTDMIIASAHGFVEAPLVDYLLERYCDAYFAEMRHFVAVIEGLESSRSTAEEARCSLALAECVIESARTGKSVHAMDLRHSADIDPNRN